ncbi:hypothetical protein [Candidatus Spongiihabitans sp.]
MRDAEASLPNRMRDFSPAITEQHDSLDLMMPMAYYRQLTVAT